MSEDDVVITSKEQLLYYEFFRKHFAKPSSVYKEKIGRQCPNCKSYVKPSLDSARYAGTIPSNFLFFHIDIKTYRFQSILSCEIMCGIVGIFNISEPVPQARDKALRMATKIRHRGPDWSGIYSDDKAILAHERLSIVDVEHGAQPLFDKLNGNVLGCKWRNLQSHASSNQLKKEHLWQTKSDCEVILYLYDEYGPDFLNMLNGMFAFILYDKKKGALFHR